ncbi:endonuclease and reverse transcriptase [Brachionus plicatilis]|uniref:Endonuclease and reverse transcriptase n=1 Tax=Brachionus plicatilis TaxID=10195 RepID=A0A3M7SGH6_BRAPC|nr:endonuclease and reverse transcriptase [Brachionus plicatilis]
MWIFINDIPRTTPNYAKNESLLFAGDLFSFYFDRNIRRIQCVMQRYLRNLEEWLKMWRLKTSGSKCSYNIYQKNLKSKEELNLQIFGEKIVRDQNPKYLGVILDSNMSLKPFVEHIRASIEEEDEEEELIQPPTKIINRASSQNVAHEKVTLKHAAVN